MTRLLFLLLLLILLPRPAYAQSTDWEICAGAMGRGGPALSDCRRLDGPVDPQGRQIWIRTGISRPLPPGSAVLQVIGIASSEAWLNGLYLGANGTPGPDQATERPGLYKAVFAIPEEAWRPNDNVLIVRLSSFHGGLRLAAPMGQISVRRPPTEQLAGPTALTLTLAGALLAAAFGFSVIHVLRRTRSSLALAGMAGTAAAQAFMESLRILLAYSYPLHIWRLGAIWLLAASFSLLLVAFIAGRFHDGNGRRYLMLASGALGLTLFAPGFDLKTVGAVLVGLCLSCVLLVSRLRERRARWALAYLGTFILLAVATPTTFVDFSFFLFAATFLLPLLMLEVVRLGRDDRRREEALVRAATPSDRIAVVAAGRVELVPIPDIVAVTGADDYVELRLRGGRRLLHTARLDRLDDQLPEGFLRIHRSTIANLAYVEALERHGRSWQLRLSGLEPLPVSGKRLASLREAITAR